MLTFLTRYLGLLRQADFRRLWLSMSVSTLGSEVTFLALPLVAILVLHATPVEVAILGAMPFVAFAIFGLPAGVWVDRVPRKRVMVIGDLGRAAVLLFVPLAAIANVLAMWQLYVIAYLAGVLTVFSEIAYQSILPELVDRDRLAEGNSRLEVSRSASQVIGPGIGGALVGANRRPDRDGRGRAQRSRLGATVGVASVVLLLLSPMWSLREMPAAAHPLHPEGPPP